MSSYINGKAASKAPYLHELDADKQGKATGEIRAIFGRKAFPNPKPTTLIRSLIQAAVGNDAVILDFFAGSATTAQAVIELNAEDGGTRRFIMVSSTEATTDEPNKNLCRDITAQRIRLLNASEDPRYADLAAEFAYLRCKEVQFENLDQELRPQQVWAALEAMHDLPLTEYRVASWQEHRTETLTLIFANKVDGELVEHIRGIAERRENAFVYSWAPGQITQALGPADIEVRGVHETLLGRFRQ